MIQSVMYSCHGIALEYNAHSLRGSRTDRNQITRKHQDRAVGNPQKYLLKIGSNIHIRVGSRFEYSTMSVVTYSSSIINKDDRAVSATIAALGVYWKVGALN